MYITYISIYYISTLNIYANLYLYKRNVGINIFDSIINLHEIFKKRKKQREKIYNILLIER